MGVSVKMTSSDKQKFVKDLRKFTRQAEISVSKAIEDIAIYTASEARRLAPVGVAGILAGSITTTKRGKYTYRVSTNTGYGLYVEFGRKPGKMPPVKAITGKEEPLDLWVKRKGLGGTFSIKTKRRTGNKNTRAKQDEQMAFFVARKIGKKGTKAQPFMRPAFERARKRVFLELRKNFKKK